MNPLWRPVLIVVALAPPAFGALGTELNYIFDWNGSWPFIVFYGIPQLLALTVLYKVLKWRWWIKVLAALPLVAVSLGLAILGSLVVAAENGDGL